MTTNNDYIEPDDYERVAPGFACPKCAEDDIDSLVWIDDEKVRCDHCGTVYNPRWWAACATWSSKRGGSSAMTWGVD